MAKAERVRTEELPSSISVTIRNLAKAVRAIPNADRRTIVIDPGQSKSLNLHPQHAEILRREAAKEGARIQITMHPDEETILNKLLKRQRANNPRPASKAVFVIDPAPRGNMLGDPSSEEKAITEGLLERQRKMHEAANKPKDAEPHHPVRSMRTERKRAAHNEAKADTLTKPPTTSKAKTPRVKLAM